MALNLTKSFTYLKKITIYENKSHFYFIGEQHLGCRSEARLIAVDDFHPSISSSRRTDSFTSSTQGRFL